jgi:Tfp pilus assembly protein PilX
MEIMMRHYHKQRGAALFVGMIFLLVLTVLGLTAAKVSTLDERMAGNYLRREQAYQHAEEAQNDALRYITNCALDSCTPLPPAVKLDPAGNPFWNLAGVTALRTNTLNDEQEAVAALNDASGAQVVDIAATIVSDHRDGTIIHLLDQSGGLMGLEAGSTQRADYYRVTTASRKGDLSGTAEARATDVIRQVIFVP